MKKRILASLLSLCLLVGMLPATALAAEDETSEEQTEEIPAGPVAEVQALIDELPDADSITEENAEAVAAQLAAIDKAKLALSDEELENLNIERYVAAAKALGEVYDTQTLEGETTTIEDIDGNEWTVTTTEDSITMEQGANKIIAALSDGTLTVSGTGDMPNLNNSTDMVSGTASTGYPWASNKGTGWRASVTKIVISDGITSVGSKSFIGWEAVTSVEIGKDLQTIHAGAFAQLTACTGFTVKDNPYLTAEDGVLYSEEKTTLYYYPCAKEGTEFTVPASVTLIGYNAIGRNPNLTSITVDDGNSDLIIGYGSIFGNTALKTVTLPARVKEMGEYAFSGDTALEKIVCGSSAVKTLVQGIIGSVDVDTAVILEGGGVSNDGGYTFSYDNEGAVIMGYTGSDTEITIPEKVTVDGTEYPVVAVGNQAFAETATTGDGTRTITSVIIPASVKSIGYEAFAGWGDSTKSPATLKKVTIQSDTVELANRAFIRNSALTVDMTAVKSLTCGTDVFISGQKLEINRENQEQIRDALNGIKSGVKVYLGHTSDDADAGYYTYNFTTGEWTTAYQNLTVEQDGLTYQVKYDTQGTPTASITTAYENPGEATELTIPAEITFEAFDGTRQTATVTAISGLRGYDNNEQGNHIENGIKKLTVNANDITLGTTFVYWDDLEEITVTGSNVICVGVASGKNLKKMSFSVDGLTIQSSGPVGTSPVTMLDLSQVSNITLGWAKGWKEQTPTFYQKTSGSSIVTEVYVKDATEYKTIKDGTRSETGTEIKSGFNFEDNGLGRNIVYVVNGGTVDTSKTGFEAVTRQGYQAAWYEDADCSQKTDDVTPAAGKTYYADWTEIAHSFTNYVSNNDATCSQDGTETAECDNGCGAKDTRTDVGSKLSHTFGDWETVTSPNCTDKGSERRVCSVCGYTETRDVDAAGHDWESGFTIDKAATCTEDGSKSIHCKNCSAVKDSAVIPATGHSWDNGVVIKEPTYSETGIRMYTCKNCNETRTEEIAKLIRPTSGTPTYTVSAGSAQNGTVTVSPKNASKGATVTITVKPNSGYELDGLTVTDTNGDTVGLTQKSDTQYTFTMPASKVTVEASFTKIAEQPRVTFIDVPASAYYYDAVAWAVENGVTSGTTATTFSPNAACTRAQTVTFLWRAAGSPAPKSGVNPFTDVQPGAYYYEAVLWAVENGITAGTTATAFSPDATVTRGQTVTFLHRAAGTAGTGSNPFTDVADSAYYAGAVQWALARGITSGTSATTFSPDDPCTRAQIVTFLYRAEA